MKILLSLFILFALTLTAAAQNPPETDPAPFLRLLAAVPAGEFVDAGNPLVSVGAYHDAIAAAGLDIPKDWEDYQNGDPAAVFDAIPAGGPVPLWEHLDRYGDRYHDFVGFDFFEVEYAAAFGIPPQTGIVLVGEFDTGAVIGAHTARGYTIERQDGSGTLLCPPDGCETGKVVDIAAMDPANPFGGRLGRNEPVFVADGLILNSPDFAVLEAMIAAHEGRAESLADRPEYQALAAALPDIVQHSIQAFGPGGFGLPGARAGEVNALLDSAPLPRYRFAASVGGTGSGGIFAAVVLIYADASEAAAAAAAVDVRADLPLVRHFTDSSITITYREWFERSGAILQPAQVLPDVVEGWSAVISSVKPAADPVSADPGSALYSPLAPLYEVTGED
jgi:hypothetical protein